MVSKMSVVFNLRKLAVIYIILDTFFCVKQDSALGEGSYPEPVYVCNKANLELLDHTEMVSEFQKHFTSVTGRTPRIETNYHVLPHIKYEMEYYR